MIRNICIHLICIVFIIVATPCWGINSAIQLSPEEKAWIDEKHIVRVRIGNAPPFIITHGKIEGIAIDYLTFIFDRNHIKIKYIDESEVTWPEALEYIKQHKVVDMVPTAKITQDRKKNMIFTDEYIFAPWVIFTRTDGDFLSSIEDLNGKRVSVEEGYVIHEKLKQEYPGIHLKIASANLKNYAEEPIKDLSTGLVDAYIGNLLMTTYIIQTRGYTNIKVAAPTPFGNHNQAMAIRSDWPQLAGIINKTLAAMTPEEHAAIRNKWLTIRYEYGIDQTGLYKWVFGSTGVAALFVAVVLFWNRRLKAEVDSRKKVEETLRHRENLLNDVGAIAKIGGWEMDLLTRKASWTKGTYDVVELDAEQPVPGPDEHLDYYLPEDRAQVSQAMTDLIEKDIPLDFEARYRSAKGNIKWARAMGRAIRRNGKCIKLFGTLQDITDRKQGELKIHESEQRFRELFNHMRHGVAMYDSPDDGQRFVFNDLNKAGLEYAKKNKDDVIGREVREVFPEVEELGLSEIFKRVWKTGNPERYPCTVYKDNTLVLWVESYVYKLPSGELVAIYEDITAKKIAETEKIKLETQLQQAQKLEAIGTLAGGIAHDFNNILYPIMGFAEISIEDLQEDHPVRGNLKEILQGAKRARDLVKQILSFSSQREEEHQPLLPAPLVQEVLNLLRSTLPSNIEIQREIYDGSDYVLGNPTEIYEIVMNLCTNAYHAMENNGGILRVCLNKTQSGPGLHLPVGEYSCLCISDTGTGIPPEIINNIFDPYFTTKEMGKGSGLGLSVIHGIVKNYGGAITVKSEPGCGTVFNVFLPITSERIKPEKETKYQEHPNGNETILFVDDDEAIAQIGVRLLERFGYKVTGKTSSIEALELFKSAPDRFDLVISDMAMPGMVGTDLAKKMMEVRPDIPIIICSGYSERLDNETAKAMGIKDYISKPILSGELSSKVRKILDETKKA